MHWKSPSSLRQKKARQSKSNFKAMIIGFSPDIRGIVHVDWVPEGQTVNQVYCKEVLTNLRERVEEEDLKCGRTAHGFFTKDNAPAHNAPSIKTFLTEHKITVLELPPHSPDLAPCDFFFYFQRLSLR